MKEQNNTLNSEERFVPVRHICSNGTVEIYPNYLISDQGRVGSLVNPCGSKRSVMKILKPNTYSKLGHLQVKLCVNGKQITRKVHRLVLSSFYPEQHSVGCDVDHINRDPTDNRLSNLRFVDRNTNNANRTKCPLKQIRVTYLADGRIEEYDNMVDCSRSFGKARNWCDNIIRRHKGFNAKHNILIEKI